MARVLFALVILVVALLATASGAAAISTVGSIGTGSPVAAGVVAGDSIQGGGGTEAVLGTGFTYQGRLTSGGVPVHDTCDLQIGLWDSQAGGTQLGVSQSLDAIDVSNGLFTVTLNRGGEFGPSAFNGQSRYLAIALRCPAGAGAYTAMLPRQALTAAPYALYALGVGAHNHWGQTWAGAGTGLTLSGGTTGLSGSGSDAGVLGIITDGWGGVVGSSSGWSPGVWGTSSGGNGVKGSTGSATNAAVYGTSTSGGPGVRGESTSGHGVSGTANTNSTAGVHGTSTTIGYGVYGSSNGGYGVYGTSSGTGVYGSNTSGGPGVAGNSSTGYGVSGYSLSGVGIYGSTSSTGAGIEGTSTHGHAIFGHINSADGMSAVRGEGRNYWAKGVSGENTAGGFAVSGVTNSSSGVAAVDGTNNGSGYGVHGSSKSGQGVMGVSTHSCGVHGSSTNSDGVYGTTSNASKAGVSGHNAAGVGVWGSSSSGNGVSGTSDTGDGVTGSSNSGYAGFFVGNVSVTGTLTKGAGGFKIDHPLDPDNQYLYHAFVESPEMMNVYNGNVTLDDTGEGWVALPRWFEALNGGHEHRSEFRYQLTAIGAPGPGLFVAEEISHNRFKIAGGAPGLKVSWQVTGVRHDPFAEANRIPVEEAKSAPERGTYLHPDAYGQPASAGLEAARRIGGGQ